MPTLNVEFTDDQYIRFKAAIKKIVNLEVDPSDEALSEIMKLEASACVYKAEVGPNVEPPPDWKF